jgi:hypothetical protein
MLDRMLEVWKPDWVALTCVRAVGAPDDQELVDSLKRIARALEDDVRQGRRSLLIVDMLQARPITMGQRRLASAWLKQQLPLFERATLGMSFAIDSQLLRGLFTALLWFAPMKLPQEVVASLDDAVRWAIARLEAEHLEVPERLRRELGAALSFGTAGT